MSEQNDQPLFRPQPAIGGTSAAAGEVAARSVGSWRQRILARLEVCESTLFEVAAHYEVEEHRISGRFTGLVADGYIEPTGERRIKPATGCPAEVYRIRRAQSAAGNGQSAIVQMLDRDYPLSLRIGGDVFDRQDLLPRESYPGVPYSRRADTGGLRLSVRIEIIDCPGCGKPLFQLDAAKPAEFTCGNQPCRRRWRTRVATSPGSSPILALVMEEIS